MKPQKRYRIELGDARRFVFMLIGCGGTGSFAALHLARLAWSARQNNIGVDLVFIDPDTVEEKNVGRQNFCPAEIGQPKAVTLARRFGLAFGLEIRPVVAPFSGAHLAEVKRGGGVTVVLVGAVDSTAARAEIDQVARLSRLGGLPWWLDAGNGLNSGQVLIGNSAAPAAQISPLGVCVSVPLPSVQEPGIVAKDEGGGMRAEAPLSCAELMALDAQSLMINQAMAGWLGVYAYRLVLGRDLDIMATYVDLRSGSTRSTAITGGKIIKIADISLNGFHGRDDDEDGPFCPDCGGELTTGRDTVNGAEIDIIFCPECGWRMTMAEFTRGR